MNETGDWTTPMLDGSAYLDKPPLMYWLTAISLWIFGEDEFAARLPSVVAAFATVLLVYHWGQRIIGSRGAWLGAISLLLCGGFAIAGRLLILDALLTFFVIACLLSGYIAVREPMGITPTTHRWKWWIISGVACAFGVLTKGPIALILCCPPLVISGWLRRDQTRIRALHWAAFVVPMAMVCFPWYVAVWRNNPEFGNYFFWEHNVKRFTSGSNHAQPFWFYLPVMMAGMFPTSLLIPSLTVFLFSRMKRKRSARSKDLGFLLLASSWILLFFSIASCKLPTYILPAIPLVCLMIGGMLDNTVFKPQWPSRIATFLKPFPQRASMIVLGLGSGVIIAEVWIRGSMHLLTLIAIAVSLICYGVTIRFWNRDVAFSPKGWVFCAFTGILMLGFTCGQFVSTISHARSLYAKVVTLACKYPGATILFYGEKPHALNLQVSTECLYIAKGDQEKLEQYVASKKDLIVITGNGYVDSTRAIIAGTHNLVSTGLHKRLYLSRPHQTSSTIATSSEREFR